MGQVEELTEYITEERLKELKETILALKKWSETFQNRVNNLDSKINSNSTDLNTMKQSF